MSKLSRRRSKDSPQESRQIFYGDVPVGWIGVRSGVPTKAHQWGWKCGFYPGMEAGQHRDGSATSFKLARRHFLSVWRQILPTLDGAAFEAYRQGRTFHKWKYRMWNEGVKMPTQVADGKSKCFCGAEIDLTNTEDHIYSAHMDLK